MKITTPLLIFSLIFMRHASAKMVESSCAWSTQNIEIQIPVGNQTNGVTQDIFNEVSDKMTELYTEELANLGYRLRVYKLWQNPDANAGAMVSGRVANIYMYGGMARHPDMTRDGFLLVACHEMGHHLGGEPRYPRQVDSNEGQSDYFAASSCFKRAIRGEDHQAALKDQELSTSVISVCSQKYANSEDQLICYRTALAGKSLASVLASLRNIARNELWKMGQLSRRPVPIVVGFDKKHAAKVKRIYHGHSHPQCRLDTYYAGMLCDEDGGVGIKDGFCTREKGYTIEARPACWYTPNPLSPIRRQNPFTFLLSVTDN